MEKHQLSIETAQAKFPSHGMMSSFCRKQLDELREQVESNKPVDYPTGDQRRRHNDAHRTSVKLRPDQVKFIKDIDLVFSHYIQNQIQEKINRERKQKLDDLDPLISPAHQEIITHSLKGHLQPTT